MKAGQFGNCPANAIVSRSKEVDALNRRNFLKMAGSATAGVGAAGRWGTTPPSNTLQTRPAPRQVIVGGRRVKIIDMHAHCVIPVTEIVRGTPLADNGGGGRN